MPLDIGMSEAELREAVLERAAQKIADDAANEEWVGERVQKLISDRINAAVKERLTDRIEVLLNETLRETLNKPLQAVDMWGEKVGEPTSIREQLSSRARDFWNTKVKADGTPLSAGDYDFGNKSKTRAEWMLGKIVSEQFMTEVKQNAVNILATFKERLRADGHAALDKHLDELVRVKSR